MFYIYETFGRQKKNLLYYNPEIVQILKKQVNKKNTIRYINKANFKDNKKLIWYTFTYLRNMKYHSITLLKPNPYIDFRVFIASTQIWINPIARQKVLLNCQIKHKFIGLISIKLVRQGGSQLQVTTRARAVFQSFKQRKV